jgi:hypothetical protein
MGELDKFSSKVIAPGNSKDIVERKGRDLAWLQGPRVTSVSVARIVHQAKGRFALALDATGSMASLIDMAKASIEQILRRVMGEASRRVEIMLVAYRDYDVPNDIVMISEQSEDPNRLIKWLKTIRAHGGGCNDGEAVEVALTNIESAGQFDAVLLAGDEPPNHRLSLDRHGFRDQRTAQDLARGFGQANTPIHTFVVGQDPRTVAAFAEIAALSGGKSGKLDGSAAMIDMAAMAMLAALKGSEGVKSYMKKYHLTSSSAEFGRLLLEGPRK